MIQHFMIGAALGTLACCIPAWVCVKLMQISIGDFGVVTAEQTGAQEVYVTQNDYPHQQ